MANADVDTEVRHTDLRDAVVAALLQGLDYRNLELGFRPYARGFAGVVIQSTCFRIQQVIAKCLCAKSVSYTHPDVYKRQAQGRPTAAPALQRAAAAGAGRGAAVHAVAAGRIC